MVDASLFMVRRGNYLVDDVGKGTQKPIYHSISSESHKKDACRSLHLGKRSSHVGTWTKGDILFGRNYGICLVNKGFRISGMFIKER